MTTGVFSRNIGKLFSKLKLVTDNLSLFVLTPTILLLLDCSKRFLHSIRRDIETSGCYQQGWCRQGTVQYTVTRNLLCANGAL